MLQGYNSLIDKKFVFETMLSTNHVAKTTKNVLLLDCDVIVNCDQDIFLVKLLPSQILYVLTSQCAKKHQPCRWKYLFHSAITIFVPRWDYATGRSAFRDCCISVRHLEWEPLFGCGAWRVASMRGVMRADGGTIAFPQSRRSLKLDLDCCF